MENHLINIMQFYIILILINSNWFPIELKHMSSYLHRDFRIVQLRYLRRSENKSYEHKSIAE